MTNDDVHENHTIVKEVNHLTTTKLLANWLSRREAQK